MKAARSGAFGPAFFASLVTIVREGVEVILVVTMLLALVAKAAAGSGHGELVGAGRLDRAAMAASARATRAIWWGVGLAGVASIADRGRS